MKKTHTDFVQPQLRQFSLFQQCFCTFTVHSFFFLLLGLIVWPVFGFLLIANLLWHFLFSRVATLFRTSMFCMDLVDGLIGFSFSPLINSWSFHCVFCLMALEKAFIVSPPLLVIYVTALCP